MATYIHQGAGKRPWQCCSKAQKHRRQPLEGPRVGEIREGPEDEQSSVFVSAQLPVLLLGASQNDFHLLLIDESKDFMEKPRLAR